MPGMIFGLASSPLVDAGIQYPRSRPIPMVIRPCLDRRQAGVIGKGLSRWAIVHIDDTADLIALVWDAIVTNSNKAGHGWEGFYIVANDELSVYDLAKETGRVMKELGLSSSDEVTTFTPEEVLKYFPHVRSSSYSLRVCH